MKRCERQFDAATAAGVQALVRKLCGRCICESGEHCPLFSYATEPMQMMAPGTGEVLPTTPKDNWGRVVLDPQPVPAA